ncbi:MAG: formylglycine-generating enzyme family protein, partial [Sulfurovaceae bacterium]|nr:formylglycine-generating enzyme family protein [Sulfurovaceae bacterium]
MLVVYCFLHKWLTTAIQCKLERELLYLLIPVKIKTKRGVLKMIKLLAMEKGGIALLRDSKALHKGYQYISGILHGRESDKSIHHIEQMIPKDADRSNLFEHPSKHILYSSHLQAFKYNNRTPLAIQSPSQVFARLLKPLQASLGGELLSSAIVTIPPQMKSIFDLNPWDALVDICPVSLLKKSEFKKQTQLNRIPFFFERSSVSFIGWQTPEWLLMMFDCEYQNTWEFTGARVVDTTAPTWASNAGEDQYGRYADLEVNGVIQRFRWIEAGTFWMGSPQDEKERVGSEEAQHKVALTQGFWLADTACTQELWMVVMGENPAYFSDHSQNPVELVNWLESQTFINTLNQIIPDLNAQLPSEAQWEYACRAGTTTPFSFGEMITTDQVNYDGNHPYGGGEKGEYRDKTVAVKALPANQWGLYQMHGNVWEWCQDQWNEDLGSSPVTDPVQTSINTRDDSDSV